jgi:hypothetical protein
VQTAVLIISVAAAVEQCEIESLQSEDLGLEKKTAKQVPRLLSTDKKEVSQCLQ